MLSVGQAFLPAPPEISHRFLANQITGSFVSTAEARAMSARASAVLLAACSLTIEYEFGSTCLGVLTTSSCAILRRFASFDVL
jgi:hypothetical protein